jgi:hypothetical protein
MIFTELMVSDLALQQLHKNKQVHNLILESQQCFLNPVLPISMPEQVWI